MDPNILGKIISLYVSVKYPGGTVAFTKDGGLISLCHSDNEAGALLYHPNLPQDFGDAIRMFNQSSTVKITVVKRCNFMDCNNLYEVTARITPVVQAIAEEYCIKMIVNPYDPLILSIMIPDKVDNEIIPDIITRIDAIPGLLRCYVVINGKTYVKYCNEDSSTPTVKIEPERCTITEDRITNLKITLAQDLDVMDFIKQL